MRDGAALALTHRQHRRPSGRVPPAPPGTAARTSSVPASRVATRTCTLAPHTARWLSRDISEKERAHRELGMYLKHNSKCQLFSVRLLSFHLIVWPSSGGLLDFGSV